MINYEELEQTCLIGFQESLEHDLIGKEFYEEDQNHFPVLFEEEETVSEALYAKAMGWA